MCQESQNFGVTCFASDITLLENDLDFEKIKAQVIQQCLQGPTVKNIESESMEANSLSHILF